MSNLPAYQFPAFSTVQCEQLFSISGVTLPDELAPLLNNNKETIDSDLAYTQEFRLLMDQVSVTQAAQYGKFTAPTNSIDWPSVKLQALSLLAKSNDIRLYVLLCRAQTRLSGVIGFAQVLALLTDNAINHSDSIHPRLWIEGEHDPLHRAFALAELCDNEGMIKDLRKQNLPSHMGHSLTMQEIERAFTVPRVTDALAPETVNQMLHDLYHHPDTAMHMPVRAMQAAGKCLVSLHEWAGQILGNDAPNFAPLNKFFAPFLQIAKSPNKLQAALSKPVTTANEPAQKNSVVTPFTTPLLSATTMNRQTARQLIAQAQQWFEENEPSSPVALLLAHAHHLVGLPFAQVYRAIPPELVADWAEQYEANK